MNYLNKIKKEFNDTPDLIIKKLNIGLFRNIYLIYLETVTGTDKINDYILKNLINSNTLHKIGNLQNYIAGPHTIEIDNFDKIEFYLTSGFAIILDGQKIYGVEARADI